MNTAQTKIWALPLAKVKPGETAEYVIESETPVIIAVHYAAGPFMCPEYPCALCYQTSRRTSVFQIVSQSHFKETRVLLLELPAHVWSELGFFATSELARNLRRGDRIVLTRKGRRTPLRGDIAPSSGAATSLSDPRHIVTCVARLYKLQGPEPEQDFQDWFELQKPILHKRAEYQVSRSASTNCAS